jgi:tetratricopeptide (TPR) repeat protein
MFSGFPYRLTVLPLLLISAAACTSSKAVKAESIRLGNELVARRQFGQAAAAFRDAVNADPQDAQLRIKLANSYQWAGRYAEAATQAVQAAALLPGDLDAQLFAAGLLLWQSRFVEGADQMSVVLRDHPDNVTALLIFGNAKARLSSSTWALEKLAEPIRDNGRFEGARRELRQQTTSAEDAAAEQSYRKALRLAPDMREAQLAVVSFLWAKGRPDEGEELLKAVAERNPGYTLANLALGDFYLARQRGAEAERYLKRAAATGTFGREARFVLADHYLAAKRDDDARTVLRRMLPADDAAGAVALRMARLEFRSGQRDQAQRRLGALLARDPINRPARLLQAQFAVALRDWDRALPLARTAVSQDTKSSEAQSALGQALFATGDLENASEAFAEAVRLDPDGAESQQQLAQISLALGRRQEALQYAQLAARKNPDDRHAAVFLVKTLLSVQDYSSAEEEIRPLVARYPSSPDVLAQLGTVQLALGQDEAARAAFVRTLELDRDSEDALSGLVSLEMKGQRTGDVRRRVEAAVAAHPQNTDYLLLAARLYAAEDDVTRAESTLHRVLDIDRANESATLSLAVLLHEHQRADEAKRLLENFVQQRPRSVEAQTALGRLLEKTGHPAEARAQYEKIVALNPRAAEAASRLAALYVAQGENLDVAMTLAAGAKQLLPNDPAVNVVVGSVYARKGLPVAALPYFQDAARAEPGNATYHFHLGSAYRATGRLRLAREEFSRALQIDPNFAFADQTRQALGAMPK